MFALYAVVWSAPWQSPTTRSYLLRVVALPSRLLSGACAHEHPTWLVTQPLLLLAAQEVPLKVPVQLPVMRAPLARYMWMRPEPDGIVNSDSSIPIPRKTHSISSRWPVEMAILGSCVPASPSDVLLGSRD